MDESDVVAARPLVVRFVRAVAAGDRAEIDAVCFEVAHVFNADGPQTLALLTADMLIEQQNALRSAVREATRNAEGYLDQKRRVTELRTELEDQGKRITAMRLELNNLKTAKNAA